MEETERPVYCEMQSQPRPRTGKIPAVTQFAYVARMGREPEPCKRRPIVDKKLEMRCKIEAVFEHYAEQSEYYRRANVAQRIVSAADLQV